MNRKLLHDLIRLREVRLREHTARLKQASRSLADIQRQHELAIDSAGRAIESADSLAYLDVFGQSRIKYAKLAVKAEEQVRGFREEVGVARKLADSARQAGAELRSAIATERDRSLEAEAEHFFGWSKASER
jgi:hypothetical protein